MAVLYLCAREVPWDRKSGGVLPAILLSAYVERSLFKKGADTAPSLYRTDPFFSIAKREIAFVCANQQLSDQHPASMTNKQTTAINCLDFISDFGYAS